MRPGKEPGSGGADAAGLAPEQRRAYREFLRRVMSRSWRRGQISCLGHLFAACLEAGAGEGRRRAAERIRREVLPYTALSGPPPAGERIQATFDPRLAVESIDRFYRRRSPAPDIEEAFLTWLLVGDFTDGTEERCRELCRREGVTAESVAGEVGEAEGGGEGAAPAGSRGGDGEPGFGRRLGPDDLHRAPPEPLLGRDDDLARHLGFLETALLTGQHYVLEGAPGAGKTAFLPHLLRRALGRFARSSQDGLRRVRFVVFDGEDFAGSEEESKKRLERLYALLRREPHLVPVFDGFERLLDRTLHVHEHFLSVFGGMVAGRGRTFVVACRTGPAHTSELLRRVKKYPLAPLPAEATRQAVERRLGRLLVESEVRLDRGEGPEVFAGRLVELAAERYPGRAFPEIALYLAEAAVTRAKNRLLFEDGAAKGPPRLDFDRDAWRHVAEEQGLDLAVLGGDRETFYRNLRTRLGEEVMGQDHAVEALCRRLHRQAGLPPQTRPRGRFLFAGPPGVGKTALGRALARHLGLGEEAFFRFNMSEYSGEGARTRFLGADPGYVGFKATRTIYDQVRARPSCVVLLDEIDRCHASIQDILLSVLEGHGNDSEGRAVSFSQAIFLMTTNLGQEQVSAAYEKARRQGWSRERLAGEFTSDRLRRLILSGVTDETELAMAADLDARLEAAKDSYRRSASGGALEEIGTYLQLKELRRGFERVRRHSALDRAFLDRIDLIVPFFPLKEESVVERILDKELRVYGWPECPPEARQEILRRALKEEESVRPIQRLIRELHSRQPRTAPPPGPVGAKASAEVPLEP